MHGSVQWCHRICCTTQSEQVASVAAQPNKGGMHGGEKEGSKESQEGEKGQEEVASRPQSRDPRRSRNQCLKRPKNRACTTTSSDRGDAELQVRRPSCFLRRFGRIDLLRVGTVSNCFSGGRAFALRCMPGFFTTVHRAGNCCILRIEGLAVFQDQAAGVV